MKNNANTKNFYGEKSKPGQADSIQDTGTAYQNPGLSWQNQDSWNVWFRDKVHEILSPKLVHKSW